MLYYLQGILYTKEIFYIEEYSNKSLDIEKFYPSNLVLKDLQIGDTEIRLSFHTDTTSCNCPKCGISNTKIHTTYHRKVQDLPIFENEYILISSFMNLIAEILNVQLFHLQRHWINS